jgi:23S rRNA (guanosine2251-2'-O)-methyltransferase
MDRAADLGFTLYGTAVPSQAPSSDPPLEDLFSLLPRLPAALVLGSEEDGLRPGIRKRCRCLLTVPVLRPFNSLTVAQAGAIILGWFARHAGFPSSAAFPSPDTACHKRPGSI